MRAGGEIEHRRHPAAGVAGEQGNQRGRDVRQQQADAFAPACVAGDHTAEDERAGYQLAVTEWLAAGVLDDQLARAVPFHGLHNPVDDRGVEVAVGEGDALHDVAHARGRGTAACGAVQPGGQVELLRRQKPQGDPREPADPHLALQVGEAAVLGAFDAHRQDGRIGMVGDHARPVVHLHGRAGDGDTALREDDRLVAVAQVMNDGLQRQRVGRVQREEIHEPQEGLEGGFPGHQGVDGEGGALGEVQVDEDAVQQRHVVGDDEHPLAGGMVVLQANDPDPEQQADQPSDRQLEHLHQH